MIPKFDELRFDENGHIYKLDGDIVPSVTTLMKPLSDSKYENIPKYVLDNAADKGTAVHGAVETYVKFGFEDIDDEYRPYFDAFLDWYKNHDVKVLDSESPLYHKIFRYAGTADLLAIVDNKLSLIDIKTTYTIMDMTCRVQLEAYSQALKSHGIEVEEKYILQLRKDGGYKFTQYESRDAEAWRVFTSLKILYDYMQSYKK